MSEQPASCSLIRKKGRSSYCKIEEMQTNTITKVMLKGTGHDFCWSGKPIYHLQKQGNKHKFQKK